MRAATLIFAQTLAGIASAVPAAAPLPAGAKTDAAGNVIVPGGLAPEVQQLKPVYFLDQQPQRVKVRYGPYKIPAIGEVTLAGLASGEEGKMATFGLGIKKPCAGECGITTMVASLEYANGTQADLDSGAWLHHVVMVVNGNGHKDSVCAGKGIGMMGERFFSSGNERTPTAFGDVVDGQTKAVFPIKAADSFAMQLELMNMERVAKEVYYTVDYEYIPGKIPAGWMQSKAIWLDVTNCGASSVPVPKDKKVFNYKMNPWQSNIDGSLMFVAGHLHDGGTNVKILKNGQPVCKSVAKYSKPGQATAVEASLTGFPKANNFLKPDTMAESLALPDNDKTMGAPAAPMGGMDMSGSHSDAGAEAGHAHGAAAPAPAAPVAAAPVKSAPCGSKPVAPVAPVVPAAPAAPAAPATEMAGHSHGALMARDGPHGDDMPHIESMTSCKQMGPIKKGDTLSVEANYDLNSYMAMTGSGGGHTAVMGIAIMYAAFPATA